MSDISSTAAAGGKALWAAVGVLGTAVVGLGGALYYQQSKAPAAETPPAVSAPAASATPEKAAHTPAPHTTSQAPHSTTAAKPAAHGPQTQPAPAARPVCVDCATVMAVTTVEREGQGSGTGAVAGGVLGAIVGNQVGQGQGKDVATIIGAIGGGIAGNQVEKKMKKVTVYVTELRMDDGSRRTLELAEPAGVGARVRVNGNALSPL